MTTLPPDLPSEGVEARQRALSGAPGDNRTARWLVLLLLAAFAAVVVLASATGGSGNDTRRGDPVGDHAPAQGPDGL